jgi:hypothetical protein
MTAQTRPTDGKSKQIKGARLAFLLDQHTDSTYPQEFILEQALFFRRVRLNAMMELVQNE